MESFNDTRQDDIQAVEIPVKIRAKGLGIHYGKFAAVENINLDIKSNKITAIIGPSGCGKSTVLRCMNRMNMLVGPVSMRGTVQVDGQDIYAREVDVVEIRKKIGMIFQRPNPFPKSIYDNVAYGPALHWTYPRRVLDEIVENSLRQAALWEEVKDKLHQSALSLSGGQQQRLCIARALAVEPEVLLMDEPCSALDPIATDRIEVLIKNLAKELTIVIVTHNLQQAARISDETAFFMINSKRTGFLVEFGPTAQIFYNPIEKQTEDYITGRFG